MPGTKISDYQLGDSGSVKWNNFLTTIEKQRKGFIALSLTNYGNNSEPAIEAGSYVEISGALYGFTSEESINGTPSSGNTNYIYIDTSDLKPYWTTTAPTWSADKNGWYDSTETDRYIGGCYYDGTNYTGKWAYSNIRNADDLPEGSTNKYFSDKTLDDLPDGSTYKKVRDVDSNHWITNSSIKYRTIKTSERIDYSNTITSSITLVHGVPWYPPEGFYHFVIENSSYSEQVAFEIMDGYWYQENITVDGKIIRGFCAWCDGVNTRFYNRSSTNLTVEYMRLR